jgi:molybdopterin converting factor subunit 1
MTVPNSGGSVTVCVLLFAAHRETMGARRLEIALPAGTTLDGLYDELQRRSPAMEAIRPSTSFAINREVVPSSTPLTAGDEVALLQPVSGGTR